MKTAIVISDSHGNRSGIDKLKRIMDESDYIFHLGDTSSDGNYIRKQYPDKTVVINGNCDITCVGEEETVTEIEGVKVFACHGDAYGVKRGGARLAERAKELGCTVALYGHTHRAAEEVFDGVTLFNPGTLSRYSQNTYLYVVFNDGKFTGKIVEITR